MNFKTQKILALLGLIGPIFYFLLMTTFGSLWKGYNPIRDPICELGSVDSPYKNVMNIFGFMLLGVFIILFSFAFYQQFRKNRFSKITYIFLLIGGVFIILVGFFPCDPDCIDVTSTGKLHSLTSIPQFIALPLAVFFSSFVFERDERWKRRWPAISFVLGLILLITGPLLTLPFLAPVAGLGQRIEVGLFFLWVSLVSARMLLI